MRKVDAGEYDDGLAVVAVPPHVALVVVERGVFGRDRVPEALAPGSPEVLLQGVVAGEATGLDAILITRAVPRRNAVDVLLAEAVADCRPYAAAILCVEVGDAFAHEFGVVDRTTRLAEHLHGTRHRSDTRNPRAGQVALFEGDFERTVVDVLLQHGRERIRVLDLQGGRRQIVVRGQDAGGHSLGNAEGDGAKHHQNRQDPRHDRHAATQVVAEVTPDDEREGEDDQREDPEERRRQATREECSLEHSESVSPVDRAGPADRREDPDDEQDDDERQSQPDHQTQEEPDETERASEHLAAIVVPRGATIIPIVRIRHVSPSRLSLRVDDVALL